MAPRRPKTAPEPALRPGDHVSWNSSQGRVEGTVERRLTAPASIKGHRVAASPEQPQYLVESNRTGAEAAHKPEALTKHGGRRGS